MENLKVMIVDDSYTMVTHLEKILTNNGFTVVAKATNKSEMLEFFNIYKPNFITMDLTMPEMDGFDCIKLLKSIDDGFKSIMISWLKDSELVNEAKILKINGYMQKPIKEKELIKTINEIINKGNYYPGTEEIKCGYGFWR